MENENNKIEQRNNFIKKILDARGKKYYSFLDTECIYLIESNKSKSDLDFDFDYSCIRLGKDTDWVTEYVMDFYKNNKIIKSKSLKTLRTMSGNERPFEDKLEIFADRKFNTSIVEDKLAIERTERQKKEEKIIKEMIKDDYIINFGKYKKTKIIDMINEEQLKYCDWFIKTKENELGMEYLSWDKKYVVFKWWVEKNK